MLENIKNNQEQVNDTCTDCGSFVDIGTVIDEHDNQLIIKLSGQQAQAEASRLIDTASARFEQVNHTLEQSSDTDLVVTLTFDVAVEKMLFQLENGIS